MKNPFTIVAMLAGSAFAAAVAAQPAPAATEDLERRVRVLERKLELEAEDKAAKEKSTAVVSAGEKGFGFKSADGSFEFTLRGLLQTDARFFAGDEQTLNDTFLVRRLEPSFEFGLGKLAFFKLQPQYAGDAVSTADMYGELRFHPAVALRFGKFKTPLGLESLQSSTPLMLIERGLPTEVGAGRDVGLQLTGEVLGGTTTYAIAWGNGAPDGRDAAASDTDNHKEVAARVFFEPFRNEPGFFHGLGVGIAGTRGTKLGAANGTTSATIFNNTLPRYRSPGQLVIFTYIIPASGANLTNTVVADGEHSRLSPQLYFYSGSFGLLAEHVSSEQEVSFNSGPAETFEHTAWQVVASYVLTGEEASYKGFRPDAPYATGGAPGWGAFEVSARHGVLDIDDGVFGTYADPAVSVSKASNIGVALNWYMTANARVSLDYEDTAFDGGAAAGADRADEKALLTRLQLAF
jgi:phosphate-selective porin OprO/OprP